MKPALLLFRPLQVSWKSLQMKPPKHLQAIRK